MKKIFLRLSLLLSLSFVLSDGQAQQIVDFQACSNLTGTRLVVLLSDNTVHWNTAASGWTQVPLNGLNGRKLVKLWMYPKRNDADAPAALVGLADDNSIWWYFEDKNWEPLPASRPPTDSALKTFTTYFKPYGASWSGETCYLLVQNDNSAWVYLDHIWKRLPTEGLPVGYDFKSLKSYQKFDIMANSETRYVGVLRDNSIWWSAGRKWQKLENKGLTPGVNIAFFDAYMKFFHFGMPEGRLVCMLEDNSFWFLGVSNKTWSKLETTGLPANYKVKQMRVYQKLNFGEAGPLLVMLSDGTIWWFTEGKGWTQVDTEPLGLR